jgi:hypothetical protein
MESSRYSALLLVARGRRRVEIGAADLGVDVGPGRRVRLARHRGQHVVVVDKNPFRRVGVQDRQERQAVGQPLAHAGPVERLPGPRRAVLRRQVAVAQGQRVK